MNTSTVYRINYPRLPVDEDSAYQIVDLLERFAHWLDGPSMTAAEDCAWAMSSGQSTDPESISGWACDLAEHLEHLADIGWREPDIMNAVR